MEDIEPLEIDVPTVHHIDGSCFGNHDVQDVDVVQFALGNMDKLGDTSTQVEQSMQLDRSFGLAELRPWKQGETQIDGAGIEDLRGLFELYSEVVLGVQLSCLANEHLSELGIDAPVAVLVGLGQCRPRNVAANTDMVELGL